MSLYVYTIGAGEIGKTRFLMCPRDLGHLRITFLV